MTSNYDLIAIGGGSGGLALAQRAARLGARVALIEPGRLGGTCVNRGCIPKKVMWCAAGLARVLGDVGDFGFEIERRGLDWRRLKAQREAYVQRLNERYAKNLAGLGIEHIAAEASFESPERLRVGGRSLRAKDIVIAIGGRPPRPDVAGAEHGITSDGFFALDALPARVAVVGAGYIAVELAGILHALGAQVTVLIRGDCLLREFDGMLGDALAEEMRREGITVAFHTEIAAVERRGTLVLTTCDGRTLEGFDCLLWATGRMANTEALGVSHAGVTLGADGIVMVDELQRTNVPGIHAIGDVTGHAALTPVAVAAGRRLAERLISGPADRKLDYETIPTVVFSYPPVGTIGISESTARERYGESVRVYVSRFVPLYHQITRRKPHVSMKLVTVGADERVVGCHLVGLGADEILQGFAVAVRMGATKQQFDDTVAIHPTVAEELVTMR
jgi:glutathione reductase (NADPH)